MLTEEILESFVEEGRYDYVGLWEIVRAVKESTGKGEERLRRVAGERGLSLNHVRLAIDFCAEFPEEVDERIAADERAASHLRQLVARRDRLLSG